MSNSLVGIISVEPELLAVAILTHMYSPLVKEGSTWLQPLSVPPDTAPLENVYVKFPLKSAGAVELLVLFLYKDTIPPLAPSRLAPATPGRPATLRSVTLLPAVAPIKGEVRRLTAEIDGNVDLTKEACLIQ